MNKEKIRLARIDEVVEQELKNIEKRRKLLYPHHENGKGARNNLVGLALSGGGIRSAVTNLGVLYEMSRVGLFNVVDYLSTVSGGGYIGGCITSLLSLKKPKKNELKTDDIYTFNDSNDQPLFSTDWRSFPFRDLPITGAQQQITSNPKDFLSRLGDDSSFCRQFSSRDQVFHLRNRASYLIPSTLPFGSSVVRAFGAVSASTLLSLTWFLSLIVLMTTLYMCMVFPAWNTGDEAFSSKNRNTLEETIKIMSGTDFTHRLKSSSPDDDVMDRAAIALQNIKIRLSYQADAFPFFSKSMWIVLFLGFLWGLAAPTIMHWWKNDIDPKDITGENLESYVARKQMKYISWGTVLFTFTVLLASFLFIRLEPFSYPDPRLYYPVFFPMGGLLGSLARLCFLALDKPGPLPTESKENNAARKKIMDYLAWNRVSRSEVAFCTGIFLYCLTGTLIFAILPAFILSGNSGFIVLIQAALILGLRFYFTGNKNKSGEVKKTGIYVFLEKIKRWLLGLLVPFFVLLMVIGTAAFMGSYIFGNMWPHAIGSTDWTLVCIILFGSAVAAICLSRLNFNNISPHVFYKDRLAEAFLSTLIPANSSTNKTADYEKWMTLARNSIDMPLTDLHGHDLKKEHSLESAAKGPYLLINATLNLTAVRDVKGFRRQSESFLFSKYYTGSNRTGYLATANYDPAISLGRAMTISGAALTTVMGANGSLAESFACTILGVRLGYWLPNPIDITTTQKIKRWNWKNLYYELFRYTNSRDTHIYLSDGGHCGDNLGLLPLLQRKTKLIIASDAECDPKHVFDSLISSIRRAYVDHNIKIHISLQDLEPDKNNKDFTSKHFVIGRILYPDRPWQKSWLLVIKNTLTGMESPPILNYRKKSPDFPHETTADQFFTEEQFEVYRSLGREACMEIWKDNIDIFRSEEWLKDPWSIIDTFCDKLADKNLKWEDIIRAIWSMEKGDFSSWKGFRETVREYAEEMDSLHVSDESVMVRQLRCLDKWLQENPEKIDSLDKDKVQDIPRKWVHFKEIRMHFS